MEIKQSSFCTVVTEHALPLHEGNTCWEEKTKLYGFFGFYQIILKFFDVFIFFFFFSL